jgi:hypothetical protein
VVTGASLGKISVPFIPQCHQQLDPLVMVGGSEGKLHLYHGANPSILTQHFRATDLCNIIDLCR